MSGQIYNITNDGLATFDGFITPQQCEFYIDYFEKSKQSGVGRIWSHPGKHAGVADDNRITIWPPYSENMQYSHDEGVIETTSINLNYFLTTFTELIYPKYVEVMQGLKSYNWTINSAKIQKTVPSGGYHMWHTECSGVEVMNRIFVVQLYLNDVEEGGETEFLVQQKRIPAKQGRVVIFPGSYTHYHRGNPPLSGNKYVLNLWATYADSIK